MNHGNLVKAIMSIYAWELAEAAIKGLLKVGHRRSYQEQIKAKLASTHSTFCIAYYCTDVV